MTEQVRTNDRLALVGGTDTQDAQASTDTAPMRVYSLDGLLALALAVRDLEDAG